MNRRAAAPDHGTIVRSGPARWCAVLAVVAVASLAGAGLTPGVAAADATPEHASFVATVEPDEPVEEPVDDVPVATESPIATNPFIPEERDLTSCIGALERPGCGSEARGGWRQTLVFAVVALGLVVVFGNIARQIRRRDAATTVPADDSTPPVP